MLCPAGRGLAKTLIPADPGVAQACSGAEDCHRHLSDSYCPRTLNRMNEDRTGVPKIAKPRQKAYSPNPNTSAKARQRDYSTKARRKFEC